MWRHVLRNLARRKLRTLMGWLGVVATISLVTAFQVGLDSVSDGYVEFAAIHAGRMDALVVPERQGLFAPQYFDPAPVAERVRAVPGIAGCAPRLVERVLVSIAGGGRGAALVGLDPAAEAALDLGTLEPAPDLSTGRCAITESLARRLGGGPQQPLTAGLSVTVQGIDGGEATFVVDTVLTRQRKLPAVLRDAVLVNLADARALVAAPAGATHLVVAFAGVQYDARALDASIAAARERGAAIGTALGLRYEVQLPLAAALARVQTIQAPVHMAFGVFGAAALGLTALLLYSLLSVAVEERIREHAILRTLGARRRRLFWLVLAEAVALCLCGVVGGALVGLGLARAGLAVAEGISGTQGLALRITGTTVASILGSGLVVAIASAVVPAGRAMRLSIAAALDPMRRGEVREGRTLDRGFHRPLFFLGCALATVSGMVFFVLPAAFLSGDFALLGSILLGLLLLMFVGCTLAALGVLPLVERLVLRVLRPVLGAGRDLVGTNLRRYRRRNTTTAVMFALALSFIVFIAGLATLFSRQAMALAEHRTGADVRLRTNEPADVEPTLQDALQAVDGIGPLARVRRLQGRSTLGVAYDVIVADLAGLEHVWVQLLGVEKDFADVCYADRIGYAAGTAAAWPVLAAERPAPVSVEEAADSPEERWTLDAQPIVLSQAVADRLGVKPGDPVRVTTVLGPKRRRYVFEVAAVLSHLPGFTEVRANTARATGAAILVSLPAFDHLTAEVPGEIVRTEWLAHADDGLASARALRESVAGEYQLSVESTAETRREARGAYWGLQVVSSLLLIPAIAIAVFALVASVSTSVLERRREIGVLRALGMRRRDLLRMITGEAVVLTLSSGLTGGVIGFVLAWGFVLEAAVLSELAVPFAVPGLVVVAAGAVCLGAGVLAARIATRGLRRRTVAEILRAV